MAEKPKPEKTQVLTIRLPKSLHGAIREAAWRERKSMNQFAIECLTAPLKTLLGGSYRKP